MTVWTWPFCSGILNLFNAAKQIGTEQFVTCGAVENLDIRGLLRVLLLWVNNNAILAPLRSLFHLLADVLRLAVASNSTGFVPPLNHIIQRPRNPRLRQWAIDLSSQQLTVKVINDVQTSIASLIAEPVVLEVHRPHGVGIQGCYTFSVSSRSISWCGLKRRTTFIKSHTWTYRRPVEHPLTFFKTFALSFMQLEHTDKFSILAAKLSVPFAIRCTWKFSWNVFLSNWAWNSTFTWYFFSRVALQLVSGSLLLWKSSSRLDWWFA